MLNYIGHQIEVLLDELAALGISRFPRWLLLKAYGQERVTKNIWRDLAARAAERGVHADDAMVLEVGDIYYLITESKLNRLSDRCH